MLYDAYNRKLAPAPYADRFARVLGSTLTLQQVTTVLGLADQGFMYAQADLLDECRERDGHLQCETQKREARVAGAPWELVPPPGSGKRGAEIARACTEWITRIEATSDLGRSFSDMLGDLQGGVYHGLHQPKHGAALAAFEALLNEAPDARVIKAGGACHAGVPLGFHIAPQAPHRPVLGPQVQGQGFILLGLVCRLGHEAECGQGVIGVVEAGMVFFGVWWESVGGFEVAAGPVARGLF